MGHYQFGFSLKGLFVYLLQLLPNIIWISMPPANNVLANNSSAYPILDAAEHVFGMVTVALLILLISKDSGENKEASLYIGLAALCMVGYYVSWVLYYLGVVSPWLLVGGLALLPPLYFVFAALWLRNYVAIIPCVIFGIMHVAITYSNYSS